MVYPYEEHIVERTQQQYLEHLQIAKETKKPFCGVKGPTYMLTLVQIFFLASTAIDGMHAIYLGITRQLLHLWFSSTFVKHVFGEEANSKEIIGILSVLLTSIRPPHFIQRGPRSFAP